MRHLIRRIFFYLMALWASVTINFILPRMMPGDPITSYVARLQGQGNVDINALRIQFGITNDPVWLQYFQYLGNLLHGNLGISLSRYPAPVMQVLAVDLRWTIGLVGVASVISFVIGTFLGVIVAWRRGGWLDGLLNPILTFLSAIPYFWMALGLVYLLGVKGDLFPVAGAYDAIGGVEIGLNPDFFISVLWYGFLPALTIVLGSIAGWVLSMRNSMLTTLSEDYVLMAEAKGLPRTRVMFAYAARNAILPSITGFAMSLGYVVAGSLLTEQVFSYPGIGYDLLDAVSKVDYSLVQGAFLLIAIAMLIANFLADLAYTALDPRVR